MMSKKLVLICLIVIVVFSVIFFELASNVRQEKNSSVTYSVTEFTLPESDASPLFPVYDPVRNVIWVGDTRASSSKLWEFDINSKNFTGYTLSGTSLISKISLGADETVWYIDPHLRLLGNYNPTNNTNKLVRLATNGTAADLITDRKYVWIIVSDLNQILRYDPSNGNFTVNPVPTAHGSPIAITSDKTGNVWIVEAIGKILRVDPASFDMLEFSPQKSSLKLPIAIKIDPVTDAIYVSEHGEDAVFAFYPQNETFKRFTLHPDPDALPYGMAFDSQGNLWVAEHTINKIAMLDPRTGESLEVQIPFTNPLTQFLTSDSAGNVWLAEPGEAALGLVNATKSGTK